jgi:predicted HD superfamily hydrolase involved in NAD metabolism
MRNTLLQAFDGVVLSGDLAADIPALFNRHELGGLAIHVVLVAERIQPIASQVQIDAALAHQAAWLHDIGRTIPNAAMLQVAAEFGVEVLPAEREHPGILHGKLSALMAERVFQVSDPTVLDAIRCHTTLRAHATALDKALFVADKLAWHPKDSPFRADLERALTDSLDAAVWCFIDWLWHQPLPVVHPWLREAHAHLARQLGQEEKESTAAST